MSVGATAQLRGRRVNDLVRGFGAAAAPSLAGQILGLVALAIAARRLGPGALGSYTFCISIATYFLLPVNFGITTSAIGDVASGQASAGRVAREVVAIRLPAAAVSYAVLLLITPVITSDQLARQIMPFAGLVLFTTAMNSEWILQATGRLGAIGFWRFASQVVYFLIVPFVVVGAAQRGAVHFALATVGGYAVIAVGTTVMAASRFAEWPRPTLRALGVRIKRSAATGYAMAMIQIYYYLDSVMLAYLADRRVVGVYGVAYRLPLAFIAISQMWVGALMPHAAALHKTDRKRLRADLGKILEGAIVLAVAVTVLSAAVAHDLMTSLFGNQFGGAGAPFALLMAAAGVVVVSTSVVPVVVAISGGRMFAVATTAAAAVNVALNFALIPIYGAAGAALATFAAEAAVLAVMWIPLRRAVGPLTIGWPFVIRQSSVVAGSGIALGIALRLHLGWISLPFGTVALCGVALAVAAVGRRVRGSEV